MDTSHAHNRELKVAVYHSGQMDAIWCLQSESREKLLKDLAFDRRQLVGPFQSWFATDDDLTPCHGPNTEPADCRE